MFSNVVSCMGCLSTDRKLTPLRKYLDLYHLLLDLSALELLLTEKRTMTGDIYMCWECHKILQNLFKFQQNIKLVNNINKGNLRQMPHMMENNTSLSKLSLNKIQQHNFEIVYEYKEDKKELVISEDSIDSEAPLVIDDTYYDDDDVKVNAEDRIIKIEPNNKEVGYKNDLPMNIEIKPQGTDFFMTYPVEKANAVSVIKKLDSVQRDVCDVPKTFLRQRFDPYIKFNMKCPKPKTESKMKSDVEMRCRKITLSKKLIEKHRRICYEVKKSNSLLNLMKERKSIFYMRNAFKCESCVIGFKAESSLLEHNNKYHSPTSGDYKCEICKSRTVTKWQMMRHFERHYTQYICKICGHVCIYKSVLFSHLIESHALYECYKCKHTFESAMAYYTHHEEIHTKYICHYCRKIYKQRIDIEIHLAIAHRLIVCLKCNKQFVNRDPLSADMNDQTINLTENPYCGECEPRSNHVFNYQPHLRVPKHNERKTVCIKCPSCVNLYLSKYTMTSHYKLVHLKQKTKFYCALCEKYFLTKTCLNQHTTGVHEKDLRQKNKICPYCYKGFYTRNVLVNHIRIHTGERPHKCNYCPSAFIQRCGLKLHAKSRHNIIM